MQVKQNANTNKNPHVTVRLSAKSDERILAKFFYNRLISQQEKRSGLKETLFNFGFIRKRILRFYSKELLKHWDKLLFWMILIDEKIIGFSAISWNEEKKSPAKATIHDIYISSEFRRKKIEKHVVTKFYEFCDENNLKFGFNADPEWEIFEEENK